MNLKVLYIEQKAFYELINLTVVRRTLFFPGGWYRDELVVMADYSWWWTSGGRN